MLCRFLGLEIGIMWVEVQHLLEGVDVDDDDTDCRLLPPADPALEGGQFS